MPVTRMDDLKFVCRVKVSQGYAALAARDKGWAGWHVPCCKLSNLCCPMPRWWHTMLLAAPGATIIIIAVNASVHGCLSCQVIAGLAAQAKQAGWRTLLVSNDRDLWQVRGPVPSGTGHCRLVNSWK